MQSMSIIIGLQLISILGLSLCSPEILTNLDQYEDKPIETTYYPYIKQLLYEITENEKDSRNLNSDEKYDVIKRGKQWNSLSGMWGKRSYEYPASLFSSLSSSSFSSTSSPFSSSLFPSLLTERIAKKNWNELKSRWGNGDWTERRNLWGKRDVSRHKAAGYDKRNSNWTNLRGMWGK